LECGGKRYSARRRFRRARKAVPPFGDHRTPEPCVEITDYELRITGFRREHLSPRLTGGAQSFAPAFGGKGLPPSKTRRKRRSIVLEGEAVLSRLRDKARGIASAEIRNS